MTIEAMKKNRADLIKSCRDLVDKAEKEERDFTDDEQKQYDESMAEAKTLRTRIERQEALKEQEDNLDVVETPQQRADTEDRSGSGIKVGEDRAESKPWEDLGTFLQAVHAVPTRGYVDPRLAKEHRAAAGMSEGVLSDGGYLVTPQFSDQLLHDAIETGVLAKQCRKIPMATNQLTVPGVDETSRVDGSRAGGIRGYWENEADALTSTKPKFRRIELKAKKLTGLIYMTDELLEAPMALAAWVKTGFADEFGFKIDDALVNGSGAGEPLGIINAGCKVQVAKESGQDATTIVAENIEKMFSRQLARGVKNAKFYINQDCWPQIFQLSHKVGTGGVPMYMAPGKLPDTPFGSLLGRPIEAIEQCQTLGTAGDIIFADFSQYVIGQKGGMKSASSIHVKFTTDEMTYRFIMRMDGQPIRSKALTPFKGSNTQSSFITLAARA